MRHVGILVVRCIAAPLVVASTATSATSTHVVHIHVIVPIRVGTRGTLPLTVVHPTVAVHHVTAPAIIIATIHHHALCGDVTAAVRTVRVHVCVQIHRTYVVLIRAYDGVIIVVHISVKVIRNTTVPEFIYVGVSIVHVDVVGHTQVHTIHREVAIVVAVAVDHVAWDVLGVVVNMTHRIAMTIADIRINFRVIVAITVIVIVVVVIVIAVVAVEVAVNRSLRMVRGRAHKRGVEQAGWNGVGVGDP